MLIRRGDVVLAALPFTDGGGIKRRPAVVVQCDVNNRRLNAIILAVVTSNTDRATAERTQAFVDVSTEAGVKSGLLRNSAVKCEHLLTIHRDLIERVIGRMAPSLMVQIDGCLKAALDLS